MKETLLEINYDVISVVTKYYSLLCNILELINPIKKKHHTLTKF